MANPNNDIFEFARNMQQPDFQKTNEIAVQIIIMFNENNMSIMEQKMAIYIVELFYQSNLMKLILNKDT